MVAVEIKKKTTVFLLNTPCCCFLLCTPCTSSALFKFCFYFCTVNKYVVSVHIGDRWGAETFANVYITLYGKRGDTGVRKLHTSFTKGRKFQRNKVMAKKKICISWAGVVTAFCLLMPDQNISRYRWARI